MTPFEILGLPADATDSVIRQRYLELTRQFPPEQHPERFAEIRNAYELIRDRETRIQRRVFPTEQGHDLDRLIQQIEKQPPSSRILWKDLRSAFRMDAS